MQEVRKWFDVLCEGITRRVAMRETEYLTKRCGVSVNVREDLKKARKEGERLVALNDDSFALLSVSAEGSMHIPQDTSDGLRINAKNDMSFVACIAPNTFARLIANTTEEQHTYRKLQKMQRMDEVQRRCSFDAFLNDM